MLRKLLPRGCAFAVAIVSFSPAFAACVTPSPMTPDAAASLKAAPAKIFENNASGAALVSAIRNLAATDPSAAQALLASRSGATTEQLSALGTGLAQAAAACVRTDTQAAQAIQDAVLAANSDGVTAAFRATVGD